MREVPILQLLIAPEGVACREAKNSGTFGKVKAGQLRLRACIDSQRLIPFPGALARGPGVSTPNIFHRGDG